MFDSLYLREDGRSDSSKYIIIIIINHSTHLVLGAPVQAHERHLARTSMIRLVPYAASPTHCSTANDIPIWNYYGDGK